MIRATIGIVASSSGGFDADAQAFFDRVDTAGGTLSATEQEAVNTLVLQMKADGIWSSMKAIYPMVGASAAACSQNLKSSSFTGSFTSGWTFASTGVTPNGTSAYMDTQIIPNNDLGLNNTHLSYYSRTNTVGTSLKAEMGCVTDSSDFLPLLQFIIYGKESTQNNQFLIQSYSYNSNQLIQINGSDSQGFFVASRTSATSLKGYKNSSNIATASGTHTETTMPTNNLYLAAWNQLGTAAKFSDRECAFSSIGDGLNDTEASDFYDAVQAFQTTLSRNV